MHFYTLRDALTLDTGAVLKAIPGAGELTRPPLGTVQVGSLNETRIVREQIIARFGLDALSQQMQVMEDVQLAHWEHFPCRLGRKALGLAGRAVEQDHTEDKAPLPAQLQQLRALHPGKTHFRLCLVNGFGSNLGDNVFGTTALCQVVKVMAPVLPSFSIDCLFSLGTNLANRNFVKLVPEVERVFFTGLSLDEFSAYDAYFDFDSFVDNPRYAELPPVDFCLWWMGLEPGEIPAAEKRNRLTIEQAAWSAVAALLSAAPSQRILLSPRASVPLRSIPDQSAGQLALTLLNAHPELTVVLDRTLGVSHPRLLVLEGLIDSVEKLKALVAQVEGVISVDTLTQHLADASATPTVLLCSSVPPSHFPYYPHMTALTPPGVERLPGWGRCKVEPEAWLAMADGYARAWAELPAGDVWTLLQQRMADRSATLAEAPAQFTLADPAPRPPWTTVAKDAEGNWQLRPKYQTQNPLQEQATKRIAGIARALLKPGMTVVHAGAACGELTMHLAALTDPRGAVHAFEPRRLYFQTLCANAVLAGFDRVFAYSDLPVAQVEGANATVWSFGTLDVFSSHDPGMTSNSHALITPTLRTIDALELSTCQLLLVEPPVPLDSMLAGASLTLRRCRPAVLAAPLPAHLTATFSQALSALDYVRWQTPISPGLPASGLPVGNYTLFLALPRESLIRVEGFTRMDA
jgi:hypothetical protein